jgi:cysteine desulfurase/selenocysteine lyase
MKNTEMILLSHCLLLCRPGIRNLSLRRYPISPRFMSLASDNDKMTRICLNHAGASPSPQSVIDRVVEHMQLEQAIGGYAAAEVGRKEVSEVYQIVAKLINAQSPDEIALVESATVAWTRVFYSMAERQLEKRNDCDVILISEAEYASNVVAASQWARENNWTVLAIPSAVTPDGVSTGIVDLHALDSMVLGSYEYRKYGESVLLDPSRIAMVCITHIPTNSGIVNPVEEIGQKISKFNTEQSKLSEPQILYLVDACQVRCWDAFTFTKLFANDASLISFLLHFSEVCGTGFR